MTEHLPQDQRMIIEEIRLGLYLFSNKACLLREKEISVYSYLMLIEINLSKFNQREISQDQKARDMHRAIGFPGYEKFIWLLQYNKLKEIEVTLNNVKRSLHIYREGTVTVKGKITRVKQSKIVYKDRVTMPSGILKKHYRVHLMATICSSNEYSSLQQYHMN